MNINLPQLTTIEQALTLQTSWTDALKVIEDIKAATAGQDLIDVARDTYVNDDCEIDDDAGTSPHDGGCWVQAWVHVRKVVCECQYEGVPDPETGVTDCGECDGSGVLGWEK